MTVKGQPPAYNIDSAGIVEGLFNSQSGPATLLNLAASNEIELHAQGGEWNTVLWLLASTFRDGEAPAMDGAELRALRNTLPIVFH